MLAGREGVKGYGRNEASRGSSLNPTVLGNVKTYSGREISLQRAVFERQRLLQLRAQEQRTLLRYKENPFLADVSSKPRDFQSPSTRVSRVIAASAEKQQMQQQHFLAPPQQHHFYTPPQQQPLAEPVEEAVCEATSCVNRGSDMELTTNDATPTAALISEISSEDLSMAEELEPRRAGESMDDKWSMMEDDNLEIQRVESYSNNSSAHEEDMSSLESSTVSPDLIEGLSPCPPALSSSSSLPSPSDIDSDYLLLLRERAIHGYAAEKELTRIFQEITKEMDNFMTSIQAVKGNMAAEEGAERVFEMRGEREGDADGVVGAEKEMRGEYDGDGDGVAKPLREMQRACGAKGVDNKGQANNNNYNEPPKEKLGTKQGVTSRLSIEKKSETREGVARGSEMEFATREERLEKMDWDEIAPTEAVVGERLTVGEEDVDGNLADENLVEVSGIEEASRGIDDAKIDKKDEDLCDGCIQGKEGKSGNQEASLQSQQEQPTQQFGGDDLPQTTMIATTEKKMKKRREWTPEELTEELKDKIIVKKPNQRAKSFVLSSVPAYSSSSSSNGNKSSSSPRKQGISGTEEIKAGLSSVETRVSDRVDDSEGLRQSSTSADHFSRFPSAVDDLSRPLRPADLDDASNIWREFGREVSTSLRYQMTKRRSLEGGIEGAKRARFDDEMMSLSNVNRNSDVEGRGDGEDGNLWLRLLKNVTNRDGSWSVNQLSADAAGVNVNANNYAHALHFRANAMSNNNNTAGANNDRADVEDGNLWLLMAKNIFGKK